MEKTVLVIGHRNPDTDSVCSAIAYAYLKQQLGLNAVPARAGKINPETQFVLEHFGIPVPKLVDDLYPRLSDIRLAQPPQATAPVCVAGWPLLSAAASAHGRLSASRLAGCLRRRSADNACYARCFAEDSGEP